MPNAEAVRHPNAQTRGRRVAEIRHNNYEEAPGVHRATVHSAYAAADMVDEATAEWGPALFVDGYDLIQLFLAHTAGTVTTGVHVKMQTATWNADTVGATEWYDVFEDLDGNGELAGRDLSVPWTAGDMHVAFRVPRLGRYMRFKVWADGSNLAASRATLYAARVMESL